MAHERRVWSQKRISGNLAGLYGRFLDSRSVPSSLELHRHYHTDTALNVRVYLTRLLQGYEPGARCFCSDYYVFPILYGVSCSELCELWTRAGVLCLILVSG